MTACSAHRAQNHRNDLRAQGLRPVQLWVYDTSAPGFAEECRRQSMAMAEADRRDLDLPRLMMSATDDMLDHLDRSEHQG